MKCYHCEREVSGEYCKCQERHKYLIEVKNKVMLEIETQAYTEDDERSKDEK